MKEEIEPFQARDLTEMVMAEETVARLKATASLMDLGQMFERGSTAWSLRIDDLLIGCSGVIYLWTGVGEAWALQSIFASHYPLACFRAIRWGLAEAIKVHGFRRVQAVVHESIPKDQRWVVRLGFEFEGMMFRFGPQGETYLRYALLPPEG